MLATLRTGLLLAAGAAIGWTAGGFYADLVTAPAAREAGRIEERITHAEGVRRTEAKVRADRDAAQAHIDAIEAGYLQREADRNQQLAALEAALEEERASAAVPVPSSPDRGACRVLVPGRVSGELDRIGRASARPAPAKPDGALPPRR